ncbi:MAG: DUF4270 domain-containing protein [Flavobacteriales bacterium]|nr:DUF4270 domain-containing protein [Flavobacteriales bacterium]MCB9449747.1 DUF4270 domain-containing protein [Flavobacteriales bacterium]
MKHKGHAGYIPGIWRQSALFSRLLCTAAVLAAGLQSCTEPSLAGLEIQPPQDQINMFATDTTTLVAYTTREDSLRSDETSLALLGSYNEPTFGAASASFYTHVRLTSTNVDFGPNPVLDSIVLTLAYNGYSYGDTTTAQTVEVYEVTEDFSWDDDHYSNQTFQTNPTPLATIGWEVKPTSPILVIDTADSDTTRFTPRLRIHLDPAFGQKILNESGGSNLTDNTAFLSFLKGLYVKTNNPAQATGEGSIAAFNLVSTTSNIGIYYHNDDEDSLVYALVMGTYAARVNHFEHDYTGTPIEAHLNGTATDTQLVYLSALSGVSTHIEIPNIDAWNDPRRAINKAEIILNIDPGSDATYEPPEKIQLVAIDSAGQRNFLTDDIYSQNVYNSNQYYGGTLSEDKKSYHFYITLHLRKLLSGELENHGMQLLVSGGTVSANRVVLQGVTSPISPMKLVISYTEF